MKKSKMAENPCRPGSEILRLRALLESEYIKRANGLDNAGDYGSVECARWFPDSTLWANAQTAFDTASMRKRDDDGRTPFFEYIQIAADALALAAVAIGQAEMISGEAVGAVYEQAFEASMLNELAGSVRDYNPE